MRVLIVFAFLCATGCAATTVNDDEEIAYSPSWFSCKSRFNCVVVYDAFCQLKAVNRRYSLVYQDWSLQEVIRQEERIVCPRPDRLNEVAGCVKGHCVYPFNLGDFSKDSP